MNCLPSVTRSRQLSCLQNVSAPSPTLRNSRQGRGHVHTALTGRSAHASGILNARLVRAAAGLCTLFLAVAGFASAQFGSQAIGASATQTVTVPITGSATVNSVQVLTFGTQGQDFQANGTFNCAAQSCMQPVTFTALYPGLRSGAVVALDSSNNVLGTTYISGTGTGGLGVLIPGTMHTIAGDGDWTSEGDDEGATFSELFLPAAVALDGAGNLYIADSNHERIRIVCAAAGPAPFGITCRQAGFIYTIAGVDGVLGYTGDGQPSTSSSVTLNTPSGLAIDGAGNIYIADTGNHVIREISAANGIITTIAGTGTRGFSGDGAAATAAQLYSPTGVAVDLAGNVFIADSKNNRIRAICTGSAPVYGVACPAGNIITVAGGGTSASLGDGAAATGASLSRPYTMTLDPAGNLYIADSGNNRVRVVCAASTSVLGAACSGTGMIQTVAGNGTGAFKGDNGLATKAELFAPSGVIVDPAGNLYISDTQNFYIRKVSTRGTITSVAGIGGASSGGDNGPANAAGLNGPYGLALDGNGDLFIAEYIGNRIRQIQANLSVVPVKAVIRQGSVSSTTSVAIENDGTGALDLTSVTVGANTSMDAASTCSASTVLNVDAQCAVGAIFAPATSPALTANQAESGDITVTDDTIPGTAGSSSPLDIRVTGTAAPVNSTTVTLTSMPNPSTFAQAVTFTAAVTTGAGTGPLTATVNFYSGTTKIGSAVPLNSSGIATFTTTSLPVGADSITAAYNEDGKDTLHFSSTSDPLVQVVNAGTSVSLTSLPNPAATGQAITFTATVTASTGSHVTPDGTVNLVDGSNTIATATLTAGVATFSISTLTDGQHQMTAVYLGDGVNDILGSTSPVLKQEVFAASTVTLTSSLPSSIYGSPVTFTATVTGSHTVTPGGSATFYDGTTKLGLSTLSSGVASLTVSSLTAGPHSITASYSGDSNSAPGTSSPLTFTVSPTPTVTTVAGTPIPGIAGRAVTLLATVKPASGSATITGSVTFADGSVTLGTANLGSNGTATIAPVLQPGPHAIVATYNGDTNDASSYSAALPLDVNLATTSVAVSSSGSPATVLSSVTFTAAVTGNGGTPTGSVVFSVDGAPANTAALDGTGKASFSDSSLSVGNHTISATYTGDKYDNASTSSALTESIQAIPTTTSLGTASTSGADPQMMLVATVVVGTGPTPTGTVVFMNGSSVVGTATLDSNGVATLIPDLAPVTYNIVAQYSGDSIHVPSSSAAVKVTGAPTGFGMTISPANVTLAASQNTTVTISFKSNSGFNDTIGLGCGTLPVGVNCHFSKPSVTLSSGATATVQLTIDTGVPLGAGASARNSYPRSGGFSLAGLFLPAGLLFGWIGWRFRKSNAALFTALAAVALCGAMLITGCAGFTQILAAPGTYNIQVTGVGTASNVTHYQTITLTITK